MLHLVDASVYVFRAYFSIPGSMTDGAGRPVNALYGFTGFLGDLLEAAKPTHIAVAFDESLNTSFRNDIYPDYKANRELPPPDLEEQFGLCRRLVRAYGLADYASDSFEADDIIGTLAAAARQRGRRCVIVTRDKDLSQLLRDGDVYWDYAGNRRVPYDEAADVFGVVPERMADFLALTGDKVDNIPGVPGVGKKTAAALLAHFESLDDLYDRLDDVAQVPVRGAKTLGRKLSEHRETALLARRLTVIPEDVPVDTSDEATSRGKPDLEALESLFDEVRFGARLRDQAKRIAAAWEAAR